MSLNRVLAVGLLAASMSQPVAAADYLRGAYAGHQQQNTTIDWAGYYAGAHAGYNSNNFSYSGLPGRLATAAWGTLDPVSVVERSILLGPTTKTSTSFGAFAGINYLWDDVVLGAEADYSRLLSTSRSNFGPGTATGTVNANNYTAISTTTSNANVGDWGTIRGRLGYASGYFMPYVTAGLAMGRMSGTTTTTASVCNSTLTPGCPGGSYTTRTGSVRLGGISYGAAMGAGVDMQFFPNTFLRAEYQYVNFPKNGHHPEVAINTARVGGGVKF